MPKVVTIIRADVTAAGLRQAAACSNDANAARRMLGLALVLEEYTRSEAAGLCGMDRQTLRAAAARTFPDLWEAIRIALDAFTPSECRSVSTGC